MWRQGEREAGGDELVKLGVDAASGRLDGFGEGGVGVCHGACWRELMVIGWPFEGGVGCGGEDES